MKREFPVDEMPLPKNLPFGFRAVKWTNYGNSILCRACGRLVEFWPADRLVRSVAQ